MNVCGKCGDKLYIMETRHVDEATIRVRKCVGCGTKHWTIEEEIFREDYLKLYNEWRLRNE